MTPASPTTAAAYQVVAEHLRASILRGDYQDGVRLPTEAELSRLFQVSRQTVRRAFLDLVSEGMVVRVPGRGTFAAEPDGEYLRQFGSIEDLMSLSVDTEMKLLAGLRRRIDVAAAGRLRLVSDVVSTLEFLRLHDDVPFCHTTVYLPPAVAERLADVPQLTTGERRVDTIIGLLDTRLPHPISEAEQSITATVATESVSAALGCSADSPLLRIDRLYVTTAGEAVELAMSYFLPEHYSYRLRLRRSRH